MNYRNAQVRNALAAEYVLGTLQGSARKRFQQLMMESQTIRESTWMWEQHLNGLGSKLPPIPPGPKVWLVIERQLGFASSSGLANNFSSAIKRFWQTTAILATAAALVMAILLGRQSLYVPPVTPDTQQIAVFQNKQDATLWILDITKDGIEVQATANLMLRPTNDYQLWMVPKDGRPPIPLGLLPQSGQVTLPKHNQFDQLDIAALAVSLEPIGGSPTGKPTAVLFTAELVNT